MPDMDGVVRGRLGARAVGRPLDRLAWVHTVSTLGDALVAVALAGTLFFAVPVAAARPRVALYLLLTVAPFAVVAPLLGRLLDGRAGAGRLALTAAMALRALLAALAVSRTESLLLYPLAFGLLVCSRAHGISRTAMVPELLEGDDRDLVAINGRMARVAALGGTAGALLGVGLDRLLGGGAVLWAAAATFLLGAVLARTLPAPRRPRDPASGRDPMGRRMARLARPPGRVRLARTANTCVRAVGGFCLFLLAFELRRQGVGTAGLGLLLAGVGVGGVVGAFLLPRAARLVREDGLLAGGLLLCGTTAWLLAGRVGVAAAAAGGLAMGAGIAAARLGFESLVQREVAPAARGTAITRAETTFQLAWVAGAVVPVAFPLPTTPALLVAAAVCLLAATTYTTGLLRLGRRRVPSR
jgi:predicted MFS family arabinose efflux permease